MNDLLADKRVILFSPVFRRELVWRCPMMRRYGLPFFLSAFLFALIWSENAAAQGGRLDLGIVLGEPTGLTGKYFLSPTDALDADLAFSILDEHFWFALDYLYHFNDLAPSSPGAVVRPYIGGRRYLRGVGRRSWGSPSRPWPSASPP
ncbi:MAG: hypothetical protein M5R36_04155 [Deltaproteobacteria bacterium]|nr:hypothetical protein [Deltaproteobacteria bacterium]